jgi:hypothetical protein
MSVNRVAISRRSALTRVFEVADMGDCLAERGLEVGDVNWLGQEVERAPVHGRAGIGHVAIGGDDHGGKLRRLFLQLGEQRQSVHARHVDIGNDHVEIALVGEQSQGLHAIAREPECDRALFDLTAEPLPDQVFKVLPFSRIYGARDPQRILLPSRHTNRDRRVPPRFAYRVLLHAPEDHSLGGPAQVLPTRGLSGTPAGDWSRSDARRAHDSAQPRRVPKRPFGPQAGGKEHGGAKGVKSRLRMEK